MPGRAVELSDADYERLAAFRHALRRFTTFSAAAAQKAGLAPQQHQALLAIRAHRGEALTVGGLAERLLVAPHTAAELVGRLVGAGLVRKVEDARDRRRVDLELTAKAAAVLRDLSLAHLREMRELATPLLAIVAALEPADGAPANKGPADRQAAGS